MKEKLVTLKNLEDITGLSWNTLRTYLQGYRFTRFERNEKIDNHRKIIYCFNKDFLNEITKFLWLKRQLNAIKYLQDYYKTEVRRKNG